MADRNVCPTAGGSLSASENTVLGLLQEHARRKQAIPKAYEYLGKLWNSLEPDVARLSTGMHFGEQTKRVAWNFPETLVRKWGQLEVLQITDVQFGHACCKYERVVEYRDWVLKEPNRFMLWTGDNLDAWALWSPGSPFEQLFDPQSQLYRFCELWAPARHRILGYVGGNHERRGIPGFGDLGVAVATFLQIPYSNGKQLVDVRFGEHKPFRASLWHGSGGARTKGTIANTLERFMQQGDSQLYLMGHLHQALLLVGWRERRDATRLGVRLEKIIGAVGSSFMEAWGTYGEVKGYSAGDVMMARAVMEANGKWEVTLR